MYKHLSWVKLWINSCVSFFDRTGSNPKIRRNKIWGGQNGGILVYNSGEKQSSLVLFDLFFFRVPFFLPRGKSIYLLTPDRESVASLNIANIVIWWQLWQFSIAALIMKHVFVFFRLGLHRGQWDLWQCYGRSVDQDGQQPHPTEE